MTVAIFYTQEGIPRLQHDTSAQGKLNQQRLNLYYLSQSLLVRANYGQMTFGNLVLV
jgi:hypothetical protein